MSEKLKRDFEKAWKDYPSQDNEGYVPDRAGFKCGWFAALAHRDDELLELSKELEEQARLNGMGAEREAKLLAQLEESKKRELLLVQERDELLSKVAYLKSEKKYLTTALVKEGQINFELYKEIGRLLEVARDFGTGKMSESEIDRFLHENSDLLDDLSKGYK